MIKTEIKKAIEKHLSAEVGQVLKERLSYLEELQSSHDNLLKDVERYKDQVSKLKSTISGLEGLKLKKSQLDEQQDDIEERQKWFKTELLQLQLYESNKRADMIMGFTSALVRNTVARKSILDTYTDGTPIVDGMGNTHYPAPTTKQYDETKEDV